MSFIYEMEQTVITSDGKSAKVIGRSECLGGMNQYLIRYPDDGAGEFDCWWYEAGLSAGAA